MTQTPASPDLPEQTHDGGPGPLPDIPEDAYPPGAVPLPPYPEDEDVDQDGPADTAGTDQ